jgi:hypothetical protein
MNEHAAGAVEALAWFSLLLDRAIALGWDMPKVREEVDLAQEAFRNGLAENFRLP